METMNEFNGAVETEPRYVDTLLRAAPPPVMTPPPPPPSATAPLNIVTKVRYIAELYAEGAVQPDAAMRLICRELGVLVKVAKPAPPRIEHAPQHAKLQEASPVEDEDPTRLRRPARNGAAFDKLRQKKMMSWAEVAKRADCSHGTARSYAQGGRVSAEMQGRLWAALEA